MRWDSPFVLAAAGTFAIHLILLVFADAVTVYAPAPTRKPAPVIEMVEIEVPAVVKPPPPPVPEPEIEQPEPEPEPSPPPPKATPRAAVRATPRSAEPAPTTDVPPPTSTDTTPGGEQVVTLDSAPPSATGVAVAVGRRTSQKVGRGGSGGGTGAGQGSGSAPETPIPTSVATIKKRALPKGDYGYIDAGRDYPPEARSLGIEGAIRVRLVVDDTGKVRSAVLLNKLGHGLDQLALRKAKEIQFEPARDTDDRAVTSVVVWTFNMTLPK